jgi:hypothetical protein
MQEAELREIAEKYLVPFFSGSRLEPRAIKSSKGDGLVSHKGPLRIAFKLNRADTYRLVLTRSQPFAKAGAVIVPEIDVVRAFIDVFGSIPKTLGSQLKHDLLATFQRRVVAQAVGVDGDNSIILSAIDHLAKWGSQLYEGAPIAAAIGLRNKAQRKNTILLSEVSENDFGAVMGNGYDTLLEFNFSGQFIAHISLDHSKNKLSFCPFRQAPIAEWTTKNDRRVALTLNRLGEILVFRDQQLLFSRRAGQWQFLTHTPVISQMVIPQDLKIRTAIYETCLDASFARSGACIGIASHPHGQNWEKLVAPSDRLMLKSSSKTKAISKMVAGKRFHNLDRRLRHELSAIDGAIILSHKGVILAAGAILKISGGSTGGGRLAAAKALSNLGLGIKISQDGGILGFRHGRKDPAFRIM